MAGYVIVQVHIHDAETFAVYRDMVPPTLEPFSGRYLVRGGDWELLEGEWNPNRVVVIEFDSVEQAKAWWSSDLYAPARELREQSTDSKLIIVEGVDE